MAQPYFPADVSLRVEGDIDEAQGLYGDAARLLYTAMRRYDLGQESLVQQTRFIGDSGAYVQVLIARGLKIVYVSTAKGPVDTTTSQFEPPQPPPPESGVFPEMYTGVVKEGYLVGTNPAVLHEFGPTPSSAAAHGLDNGYQETAKLAISPVDTDFNKTFSPHTPSQYGLKPGMYSGAMKRVVQCLFGLGNIKYVHTQDGSRHVAQKQVQVFYDYKWARTHGIYKAADKNHWIVEVGGRGVLAMPLPLVEGTDKDAFREHLVAIGDVEAIKCVDEFGGFPSGDTIPSEPALTDAIAAGTVLRLLDYEAHLKQFYNGKNGWSIMDGWAFSDSGRQAHNVARYLKQATATGFGQLYWWSEHWSLDLVLSPYDLTGPARNEPVGTGSATLSMLRAAPLTTTGDSGAYALPFYVAQNRNVLWVPIPGEPRLLPVTFDNQAASGGPTTNFGITPDLAASLPDPVVRVFFDGEELQKVYFSSKEWLAQVDYFTVSYKWFLTGDALGGFYADSLDTNFQSFAVKNSFQQSAAYQGFPITEFFVTYQQTDQFAYCAMFPYSSREGIAVMTDFQTVGRTAGAYNIPPAYGGGIAGLSPFDDGSLPSYRTYVDGFFAGLGHVSFGTIYEYTGIRHGDNFIIANSYFGRADADTDVWVDLNANAYRPSDHVRTHTLQFDVNTDKSYDFNGGLDLAPWATTQNTNWTGPLNA